ncbi:multidrug transporter EmrE-like cation transporter [Flavobacterium sp. HSC-61S13]|nr:multidrug transporter EmrE-like cation transporter [Flavobacterium sp. HSC-61S13]
MNWNDKFKQKSPLQRFLFVFGLFFFFLYLCLGVLFIVWKAMPIDIEYTNRLLFGVVLIVYAGFRFFRLLS